MTAFEKLAQVLFGGKEIATDFKALPGSDPTADRETVSQAILDSMSRVGLIVDGQLINGLKPKA